jgi:hypothetical protein
MALAIILSFFAGAFLCGWYATWFTKNLMKNGYAKFEVTAKFMEEFKVDPCKNVRLKNHMNIATNVTHL